MAIVTQAALTSLRSLKYGSDQPGGGSSGEPYITQKIPPAFEQQVPSTNIWLSDNGLIRGGFAGATRASIQDTVRIGKFLKDPPRGPLFIAKQVGLQLSNPKLETRSDLLGQIAGQIGSTRIYNLGINTLAQIPVNAFGGHIVRHGLFPILNEGQLYSKVVVANDIAGANRLVRLKDKLQQYPESNIANYVGGPGSIDGIGTTTIRRTVNTLSNPQYNQYIKISVPAAIGNLGFLASNTGQLYKRPAPNVDYYLAQGVSEQYFDANPFQIEANNNIVTGSFNSVPTQIDQNVINYPASGRTYNKLRSTIDTQITASTVGRSNIIKNDQNQVVKPITFTFTGKAYSGKNKDLPLSFYNIENRIGYNNLGSGQDEINLTPLYINNAPPGTAISVNDRFYTVRDLIKFRIEAIDGDNPNSSTWMIFRAFLKDITDNPNPSWNTVNYVGRGEPFYIYKGFERNISFSFQVAAMSEAELRPMWQKLNYLYSNTMPDYNGNVMRGPYMKLTIGNYMYRQPGVIKSLNYTIGNDSPWEIAITDPEQKGNLYELPHVMNVSMTFAPIHDFLPRKFPNQKPDNNTFLPAFVVDRQTDDNLWLNSIYSGNGNSEIPRSSDALGAIKFPGVPEGDPNAPVEIEGALNTLPTQPDLTELDRIIEAQRSTGIQRRSPIGPEL